MNRTILLFVLLCLGAGTVVRAQPAEPVDPEAAERILHRFDFEERDNGNFEDLPMHWSRVAGPGLPHYVRGSLVSDVAHGGRYSFRLDLNGGSVLYRYEPGLLPVRTGAHYRVRGHVRTTALEHARARLTAYFVDEEGRMLPESVRHVIPRLGEADAAGWTRISVELPMTPRQASSLVLELGLLQPDQLGADEQTHRQGQRQAQIDLQRFRQDVEGSAWFDDVVVSRVPAVQVYSGAAGNVFARSQPVRFVAIVDDRPIHDLFARAEVHDADGRRVAKVPGRFVSRDVENGQARIDYELPSLPPGWYQLTSTIGGGTIGGAVEGDPPEFPVSEIPLPAAPHGQEPDACSVRTQNFVVLADDESAGVVDRRIAVDATHLVIDDWSQLPQLLPTLAAGRVKLGVWSRTNDLTPGRSQAFDDLTQALERQGIATTAVFAGPTAEMAEAAGGGSWADVEPFITGSSPPGFDPSRGRGNVKELWDSSLSYLVSRHAHQLDRWQIGRDDQASLFVTEPAMQRLYESFAGSIAELVARPDLAIPWPAQSGLEQSAGELPTTLSLNVPPTVTPRQIPLYVDEILRHEKAQRRELSLSLQAVDLARYGRLEQLSDLAQRITYALASGVDRITVPMPFDSVLSHDGNPARGQAVLEGVSTGTLGDAAMSADFERWSPQQPRETYLVLRTLMRHLAGCEYRGRIPAGDGMQAFLFARRAEIFGGSSRANGVLVIWDERGWSTKLTELVLNLGPDAKQIDLWGNATALRQSEEDRMVGRAVVSVGAVPTLVVGVDADLTRLRSLVRLDRHTLESSFEPHNRRLLFENPFPRQIVGRIELRAPEGWEVAMPRSPDGGFSLQPGERLDRPVELRFPYNSYAGEKTIDAHITLQVEGETQRIVVPLTVRLGLEDIGLRTVAYREGGDVVVEQTITNYGDAAINYTAFVLVPDQPRQERLVTRLAGGESTVKIYRFAGAGKVQRELEIRSGLRELEGTRILNDKVELR